MTRTLDPSLTREKPSYTAFTEARKSESIAAIRLEESTGTLHLIQYNQIGRITYTPHINLLTIPSAEVMVAMVGKNMEKAIDTIQQKKLKTISVLPEDEELPDDNIPVVLYLSFHQPDKHGDDDYYSILTAEVTELLKTKGINLTDL